MKSIMMSNFIFETKIRTETSFLYLALKNSSAKAVVVWTFFHIQKVLLLIRTGS